MSSPKWLGPAAVAIGVLAAVWAWWLERPPAPLPIDAPVDTFSAARARILLEEIAVRPHMPGSAEHARVREYLVAELGALGFEVEVQETTVTAPRGRVIRAATVRNILARKRGTSSTGGVALASHYDSQQLAPGAGDDGAGVAATLEAVRALSRGEALRNDLYVIITDAEELGLIGAQGFVAEHPWWPEISVLLNFEARGSAGQSVMFETNSENGWVVREFARADPHPSGSSLYYEIYRRLPNDTDFSVYKRAGVAGLNFAFAEGADAYHRPTDSVENLSLASLQHHGEHALSMSRHFGNLDLSVATRAPDVIFFRFVGVGLVTYPYGWVVVFSALALLFAAVVGYQGRALGRLSAAGVAGGLAMVVIAAALAAGLSALLLLAVRGAHHEIESIAGRELYNEAWYALSVAAIAVGSVSAAFVIARRWFGTASLAAGALLIPLALVVASGWLAPGVSMLFVWPTIFAIEATRQLLKRTEERPFDGADLAVFAVLAAPVILILFPLVWIVYVGLNISVAPLLALVAVVMLVLLVPLFEISTAANGWWLPSSALGLAIAFGVVGVIDARPGPGRPMPEDLVYVLDRESGAASWATMQMEGGVWLPEFFGDDATAGDLASFLAGNRHPYRLTQAPPVDAPAAVAEVLADVVDGRVRSLRVAIRSSIGPELMTISPLPGGSVALRAVNGSVVEFASGPDDAGDWLLQHWGRPPDGTLVLDLATEDLSGPVELVLVEYLMRLPPVAGARIERPAGVVAHAGRLTDVSLFRQVLRFEGLWPVPD
ncbi:MAG: M28 family peptidase [Acidobacteria bacterium]|nr:M28 family peptidase [Acidobacteriota bacterium]